jgi:hypothetical protein
MLSSTAASIQTLSEEDISNFSVITTPSSGFDNLSISMLPETNATSYVRFILEENSFSTTSAFSADISDIYQSSPSSSVNDSLPQYKTQTMLDNETRSGTELLANDDTLTWPTTSTLAFDTAPSGSFIY